MCNIKLHKGFLLEAPYWKYQHTNHQVEIYEHSVETENYIPEGIFKRNILVTDTKQLEFDIISYPQNKSAVMLSWNHTIMDGRGAGMLIKHLNNELEVTQENFNQFFPVKEKKISFFQNIKNMYEVKHFIETSSKAPISNLIKHNNELNQNFKHQLVLFTKEETELIDGNAHKQGAKFGTNLYLMACCIYLVNSFIKKRNVSKSTDNNTIWLPVPYDGRRRGTHGPIINNSVVYLFYRIENNFLSNVKDILTSLNNQMSAQIKKDMPKKYNQLLGLMRHIPTRLYYYLINKNSEKAFTSFLYSSTGENINSMKTFLAAPISDVVIFPPQTFPPGITFSFLRYNNTLKVNIMYSENTISIDEEALLVTSIKSLLLNNTWSH